jgi:hypothetical protein
MGFLLVQRRLVEPPIDLASDPPVDPRLIFCAYRDRSRWLNDISGVLLSQACGVERFLTCDSDLGMTVIEVGPMVVCATEDESVVGL